MLRYDWGIIFKKCWIWFADPFDVSGVAMANFFSYNAREASGFKRKTGLTSVIDLKLDQDEIWRRMRKSYARKQIERGQRNGVIVRQDNNRHGFKRIYHAFRQAKNLNSGRVAEVLAKGRLYSAYYAEQLIATGLFVEDEKHTRAWALSSLRFDQSSRFREIVGQANRCLIWEAVKDSQRRGLELFDLGGIAPESDDSGQRSLAEFKEAFGGERRACYYYHKVYSRMLRVVIKLIY